MKSNTIKFFKSLWSDESAQGATEYILILVAVVAVAMIFKDQFKSALSDAMEKFKTQLAEGVK